MPFPTQAADRRDFGMGGDGAHPGLFPRPVLAVDAANGGIVGPIDRIVTNRTQGRGGTPKTATAEKMKTHRKRTVDGGESYRWLKAAERTGGCLTNAAIPTAACDREGDILHPFANHPANVHLPVRSPQSRAVAEGGCLAPHCAALPEQAREAVAVPAKGLGRPIAAHALPTFQNVGAGPLPGSPIPLLHAARGR